MELGELIGKGYRCEVFALGKARVVKLFELGADLSWIQREAETTRVVHRAGIPVPAVYDIVEIKGRTGIVYERVRGPLLSSVVRADPDKAIPLAREFAHLHLKLHSARTSDLPSQKLSLERCISRAPMLTAEAKETALRLLRDLPDGDAICHGDLHLNNVMMSSTGMVVIDWDNARRGNPLADVARSVLLLNNSWCHFKDPPLTDEVRRLAATFRDEYLSAYFKGTPGKAECVDKWMIPVAAARLSENVIVEQKALMDIVGQ